MGIGSIGGISSGERSIIGISQLPVIYQVELLAYKYQNQNLQNSTLHFHLRTIVT
jgi:arginine decarboxylase-like protein